MSFFSRFFIFIFECVLFRYHLKAIESLSDDLPNNTKALICNLDLILKWISLRFYDTNPSVLLKGLEYLNLVFQKLVDNEYYMADNEGSAFIPHLLTKVRFLDFYFCFFIIVGWMGVMGQLPSVTDSESLLKSTY